MEIEYNVRIKALTFPWTGFEPVTSGLDSALLRGVRKQVCSA